VETLHQLLKSMPTLKSEKNPGTASLLGFLFGAFGVGIYFRSFSDFILAAVVWLVFAFILVPGLSLPPILMFTVAGIIIGTYGYFRAVTSNEKLRAQLQQQSH
jgi:hypothetical protein